MGLRVRFLSVERMEKKKEGCVHRSWNRTCDRGLTNRIALTIRAAESGYFLTLANDFVVERIDQVHEEG